MKGRLGDTLAFAVLLAGAVLMVAPVLWMISTSLKPAAEQFDMRLIPATPSLANDPRIFELMPFHLLLWNSVKIAVLSTPLLTCSRAAFVFAVVRFPGRNFLFVLLLTTLMIPAQITAIPHLQDAGAVWHAGAAGPAQFRGRGLRDLPDAAVFPDRPAGTGRGGADRRGVAILALRHFVSGMAATGPK